ncbi:hypothetical protein PISMIDRAFT_197976 [Pisolithus microcarpus 441]|uniref:Uncharacterized protein n=1 Tax=Pisolithus microcarpus 441 TaxID=765257 RepID=A0A0C9YVU2_9AGAM|nr:hypothetical protein PISMIDRAFT_197976 [Pisolithus microcarpus 441]
MIEVQPRRWRWLATWYEHARLVFFSPDILRTRLRERNLLHVRRTRWCSLTVRTHPKPFLNRYGVRLLPDVLPAAHNHPDINRHLPQLPLTIALPLSEWVIGFALQDTYFSSLEEAEDYRRDKCQKLIDHVREERMRVILVRDRRREGAVVDDSDV